MELVLAKAIIAEAGEYLDDVPESDEEKIEVAENLAKHAINEYNEGWGKNNDTIQAIVSLIETSEEPVKVPSQAASQKSEVGSGSSAFFRGLPVPQSEDQEPIEMPYDVSILDDANVRRYHGIFSHYFGRARYALAEQTAALTAAEHLRAEAFRKSYKKLDKVDRDGKSKLVKTLEQEAMEDSEYQSWNRNVLDHEQKVLKLKALTEIYAKNVEVLSREATIRMNEFERSR